MTVLTKEGNRMSSRGGLTSSKKTICKKNALKERSRKFTLEKLGLRAYSCIRNDLPPHCETEKKKRLRKNS